MEEGPRTVRVRGAGNFLWHCYSLNFRSYSHEVSSLWLTKQDLDKDGINRNMKQVQLRSLQPNTKNLRQQGMEWNLLHKERAHQLVTQEQMISPKTHT